MQSRSFAAAVLAVLLVPGSASAAGGERLSAFTLPGIFGGRAQERRQPVEPAPPVRLAQSSDPRVTQLEEQVRQLSGTIEELNFQILQMQEQARKQQEDIEFRFQELEGGGAKPAGNAKPNTRSEAVPPAGAAERPVAGAETAGAPQTGDRLGAAAEPVPASGAAATAGASVETATRPLGTITFDASGNVTGGSVGDQTVVSRGLESEPDGTAVAALPRTDDPEELYRNAYEFILSGDYATAEAGFRDHIARFPRDARAADAQFWLGESLLGQEKFRDAAEVFLAANKTYPKSRKAPDMLFKLGVSLAGLNQHDVACATFGEVEKRYPAMSSALKTRVKQERANTSC